MTTNANTNRDTTETEKAFKILRLNEDLAAIKSKKKSVSKAFGEEAKRIEKEIAAILSGESTDEEILANVSERDVNID